MMRRLLCAGLLALAGCATASDPVASAGPTADRITVTFRSWGQVSTQWDINQAGVGVWTDQGQQRPILGSPADFARIEVLLAPAAAWQGRTIPCTDRITDAPYGDVAWATGDVVQTTHWNLGCAGQEARAVLESIGAATEAAQFLAASPQ